MASIPDSVSEAVKAAVDAYPENPQDATTAAIEAVRQLEEYQSLVEGLVEAYIQDLVYVYRHQNNRAIKLNKGPYRKAYDDTKAYKMEVSPEWAECTCKGTGKNKSGGECAKCWGKGTLSMRYHLTAMIRATKVLYNKLWKRWRDTLPTT